jgi:hypothetical protein
MPVFVPQTHAPTHLGAFRSVSPGALSNPIGGVPILTDIFGPNARFVVQLAPSADLTGDPDAFPFVDISDDVLQPGDGSQPSISITPMGRSDEYSTAQPAGCSLSVKNLTGKYSKGPQSPSYPYVKENVPIRVLLDLGNGPVTVFYGYVNGFTPVADKTGTYNIVKISASGSTRRLFQGTSPLASPIYRAISTSAVAPAVWWPMDEGSSSTFFTPAIGTGFLVPNGAIGFGAVTGSDGVTKAATIGVQGTLQGGAVFTPTTRMRMEVGFHVTSGAIGTGFNLVNIFMSPFGTTPNGNAFFTIAATSAHGLFAEAYDSVYDSAPIESHVAIDDGLWHWASLDLLQSGADIALNLSLDGISRVTFTIPNRSFSRVFAQRIGNSDASRDVSDWMIWSDQMPIIDTSAAFLGHLGESATDRLTRLCAEENIALDLHGTSDVLMGAQSADTRLNLLRACEKADRGVLVDGFGPGLSYWSHGERSRLVQNAAVSFVVGSAIGGELDSFEPVDDDQRNVNKFTMNRQGGGKATFEDSTSAQGDGPNGVGQYESSDTINIASDTPLIHQAAWRVREGTDSSPYRYPGISVNFANQRAALKAQAWLSAGLMARVDATNPELYMQHPAGTISSVLEGYSLSLGPRVLRTDMVLGPAHPWDVDTLGVVAGAGTFILDGAAVLVDAASAGATSLAALNTGVAPWVTSARWPADFPRWLDVGGWPVRMTAADAYSNSNPYFETDISGWSTQSAGTGTLSQSSLQSHEGSFSLRFTPDGVTANPVIRTTESVANPGEFWTCDLWFYTTLGSIWNLQLAWYNLSHNLISTSTIEQIVPNAGQWYHLPQGLGSPASPNVTQLGALAPAGTAFVRLFMAAVGTPNIVDFTYLDAARLIGKRYLFTVDAIPDDLPGNTPIRVWRPAVLAL